MKKTFFLAGVASFLLTLAINAQDTTKPVQSPMTQDTTKPAQSREEPSARTAKTLKGAARPVAR